MTQAAAIPTCSSILMVGTDPSTMGGISTVVRGYSDEGLFDSYDITYVSTHRDGSALVKACTALGAWLRILARLMRGDRPLLHIHLSSRASFWRKSVICLMARAWRRPYLLHAHGSEFMDFFDRECGPIAQRAVTRVLKDAALVLALSDEWRTNLRRISPQARIEVLSNAVSVPDEPARGALRSDPPQILFLGRLGRRKGTFDLVRAFARVAADFPQARLICAGDGAIDEVRALARELGVDDRIDCPGWLDREQSVSRLAAASIFALPSYAEGLPMSLLEAMSWKLPAVTSPVGGIPQVIRNDENGLLVDAGDVGQLASALARLLREPATRDRLGAAARATIQRSFSLHTAIERLGDIYGRFGIAKRRDAAGAPTS